MQLFKKIIYHVTVISFIIFTLLVSIHFWSFNESFYKSEHQKLLLGGKHINEYIGISEADLDKLIGE